MTGCSRDIYDPASKIVQLSLPGLEVGDIYRLESIDVINKARMKDTWSGGFVGEFMSPLQKETIEVYAPKAKPLAYITKRFEIPGTIVEKKEEVGDMIHYSWEVSNVPQIFPEPAMAPFYVACQRYYFGTIPSWEVISKWYIDLCEPRMARIRNTAWTWNRPRLHSVRFLSGPWRRYRARPNSRIPGRPRRRTGTGRVS